MTDIRINDQTDTSCAGKLNGVADQIGQNLSQPCRIGQQLLGNSISDDQVKRQVLLDRAGLQR